MNVPANKAKKKIIKIPVSVHGAKQQNTVSSLNACLWRRKEKPLFLF